MDPVSNFLTLNVFCIPHPEISIDLVTEEIAGLNAKVTKPLSSILSTLAPKVIPAVPSLGSHVTTPSSTVFANEVGSRTHPGHCGRRAACCPTTNDRFNIGRVERSHAANGSGGSAATAVCANGYASS